MFVLYRLFISDLPYDCPLRRGVVFHWYVSVKFLPPEVCQKIRKSMSPLEPVGNFGDQCSMFFPGSNFGNQSPHLRPWGRCPLMLLIASMTNAGDRRTYLSRSSDRLAGNSTRSIHPGVLCRQEWGALARRGDNFLWDKECKHLIY